MLEPGICGAFVYEVKDEGRMLRWFLKSQGETWVSVCGLGF